MQGQGIALSEVVLKWQHKTNSFDKIFGFKFFIFKTKHKSCFLLFCSDAFVL